MSPDRRPKWWDELLGYRFTDLRADFAVFTNGVTVRYVDLWTDEVHDQLPEESE